MEHGHTAIVPVRALFHYVEDAADGASQLMHLLGGRIGDADQGFLRSPVFFKGHRFPACNAHQVLVSQIVETLHRFGIDAGREEGVPLALVLELLIDPFRKETGGDLLDVAPVLAAFDASNAVVRCLHPVNQYIEGRAQAVAHGDAPVFGHVADPYARLSGEVIVQSVPPLVCQ